MKKFSAKSVELALIEAGRELNCPCIDIEYEIVQYPKGGIFGLGKKDAIIVASIKSKKPQAKKLDIDSMLEEISEEVNNLFNLLPLNLEKIEVKKFDSHTILVHFRGEDSALLIGEKGYRYKAISYALFNWLNPQYGVNVRLEIEKFLHNQERVLQEYLDPLIESIKRHNKPFLTKPFDGVLAYIAIKKLRAQFPDRYIHLKTNANNQTCIEISPNAD